MIKPRFLLSLILIAVLAVACSPATSTATSAPLAISSTQIPPSATAKAETMLQATLSPSETLAPTPFPIVTSRGPHLEATDPKTVSMAAGGLQFVEFFEFWWTTCQQMAPMVHGLEATYYGRIKFTYLEISNPANKQFIDYLGFQLRPSFYLLDKDGKILHQWIGSQNQKQFEDIFAQYVQ